jgi:hypothetical protein
MYLHYLRSWGISVHVPYLIYFVETKRKERPIRTMAADNKSCPYSMIIIVVSKGWDYSSELRLPGAYCWFHGWWRALLEKDRLLIGPSELCGNLTSSHPVPKQGDLGEGNNEFNLWSIFVHSSKWFLQAVKFYDLGPTCLLPLRSKACCRFLSPLKIQPYCLQMTKLL